GASALAIVALGLPTAYLLATRTFRGKRAVEVLIDLPLVLPPTVAGVALLAAFGRAGLAGGALRGLGITLPFTTLGVVVAQTFVAIPLFVGAARRVPRAPERRRSRVRALRPPARRLARRAAHRSVGIGRLRRHQGPCSPPGWLTGAASSRSTSSSPRRGEPRPCSSARAAPAR